MDRNGRPPDGAAPTGLLGDRRGARRWGPAWAGRGHLVGVSPGPERQLEPGVSGVALDVLDHPVTGREHWRALWVATAGRL